MARVCVEIDAGVKFITNRRSSSIIRWYLLDAAREERASGSGANDQISPLVTTHRCLLFPQAAINGQLVRVRESNEARNGSAYRYLRESR